MGNEMCTKGINCNQVFGNGSSIDQAIEPMPKPVEQPMPPKLNQQIQQILQGKSMKKVMQVWLSSSGLAEEEKLGEQGSAIKFIKGLSTLYFLSDLDWTASWVGKDV